MYHLQVAEINSKLEQTKHDAFHAILSQKYGNSMKVPEQSSEQSLQPLPDEIKTIDSHFGIENEGDALPKKVTAPLSPNYRPEFNVTPELDPTLASYYQSLIGILRWIVELGRIDITCEASMMASSMAPPRMGHLKELYHMFA